MKIETIANPTDDEMAALIELLRDGVHGGASIGFHAPLSDADSIAYWKSVFDDGRSGSRCTLVAKAKDQIVGSIQLGLCMRQNGRHRAEVQKLMVHSKRRRMGIARELMRAIEAEAKAHSRSLLYLDTQPGQPAEIMYRALGWTEVGSIPNFASSPNGCLHGTAIYYKNL